MRKKHGVPEVLWRLFRDRAQTLADTVASLIPQSPPFLRFTGGQKAMPFILRPDDPADYRKLLNRCFVVIDPEAPPIGDPHPINNWPQTQIVERTIEIIIREQPTSCNVICSGYDKCNNSSPIIELLGCSAWNLLLSRVGDEIMVYLLTHTSIFLPLPRKKHHQVTGPPISSLVPKLPKHASQSQYQHPLWALPGTNCSRKRNHILDNAILVNKRQRLSSSKVENSLGSLYCSSGNGNGHIKPFSRHPENDHGQMGYFEAAGLETEAGANKRHLTEEIKGLKQIVMQPKKRSRPFKWQRSKKSKHVDAKGTNNNVCYLIDCGEDNNFSKCLKHSHEKQCSSSHALQAPLLTTKGTWIDRKPMFYNLEHSSSVLPRNHVLNFLKPNFAGSMSLVRTIFGLSDVNITTSSMHGSKSGGFCSSGSTCLYHSLIKLFKVLICRTQRCKHLRLLDKHCIVAPLNHSTMPNSRSAFQENDLAGEPIKEFQGVNSSHCKQTLESTDSEISATMLYCSKSQVVSFLWAVCRNLVPPELLGTPSNWRTLRKNIFKFIRLRRFEKFSLKQCLHKLKTLQFPFLSDNASCCFSAWELSNEPRQGLGMHKGFKKLNNTSYNLRQILLERWINWFFVCLVVPLVQAHFYVTESEQGKNEIYYYRKSIWVKVRNTVIASLKDQNYQPLDVSVVKSMLNNRSFGFSKLRLCPKESGVRILANHKASSRMPILGSSSQVHSTGLQKKAPSSCNTAKFRNLKSLNSVFRDTHYVLKGIKFKEPEKLGASVFDYNDIYRKLCTFILDLKKGLGAMPDVFIVVSDVSKAFDSIDQDKLLSVMKDVIVEDKYLLKQSYQVLCNKKALWVRENRVLADPKLGTGITTFNSVDFGSLHTVVINQGQSKYMTKKQLLCNLDEQVKQNIVWLDQKFYLQDLGIPQGSVLSSLLCSFYYGHLERSLIFSFLEKACEPAIADLSRRHKSPNASAAGTEDNAILSPCYVLLRLIDDFFFISTSKKQAASFFLRLQRGFREYNCYMNEKKYCLNFDIGNVSGFPSNRVYIAEDGVRFIQWSGLLLNSCTLEVQADYMRYLTKHLSSSLTVCWQGKPAHHLKVKLCHFMRPKCHPIFFDSNINSAPVVRLNIYQAFLLCAMKFHCYVTDITYICKLCPGAYLKMIERSFRYMYVLIKKRMCSVCCGSRFRPVLQLSRDEVEWLGFNAFIHVLKRKQSRHKELLSLLTWKLLKHKISGSVSSPLKHAVDKSHSSLLWKIKY